MNSGDHDRDRDRLTVLINDQEFTEYTNLEECITFLCEYITSKGPFAGLLGFSQVMHPIKLSLA